jgi:hypothetical protein
VQQSIRILQPGEKASSAAACKTETVNGGLLQWMDGEDGMPFHAVAGDATAIPPPPSWGDWPARGSAIRAGHEFASALRWKPSTETPASKSWRMLIGNTSRSADRMDATRAWLEAPALQLKSGGYTSVGYQPDEKAYLLNATQPGAPTKIEFTLAGSPSSPVVNPAFVIKGWGRSSAGLVLDGREIPSGLDFRHGYRKTAVGTDLIVWVRVNVKDPVTFEVLTRKREDEEPLH